VNLHLACKWFAGLMPEEAAPDHTTVCRFRAKLGPEKFQEIFNGIIQQAHVAGLVHDRLRIIDATHPAPGRDEGGPVSVEQLDSGPTTALELVAL